MVEMVVEEKLMKYKTGRQLALVQQLMLFGIMVPKICTESVLKEWLVLFQCYNISIIFEMAIY